MDEQNTSHHFLANFLLPPLKFFRSSIQSFRTFETFFNMHVMVFGFTIVSLHNALHSTSWPRVSPTSLVQKTFPFPNHYTTHWWQWKNFKTTFSHISLQCSTLHELLHPWYNIVCVCVYVCIYVCICMYMYEHKYVCVYVCMYVCTHINMCVCICMYVCT